MHFKVKPQTKFTKARRRSQSSAHASAPCPRLLACARNRLSFSHLTHRVACLPQIFGERCSNVSSPPAHTLTQRLTAQRRACSGTTCASCSTDAASRTQTRLPRFAHSPRHDACAAPLTLDAARDGGWRRNRCNVRPSLRRSVCERADMLFRQDGAGGRAAAVEWQDQGCDVNQTVVRGMHVHAGGGAVARIASSQR